MNSTREALRIAGELVDALSHVPDAENPFADIGPSEEFGGQATDPVIPPEVARRWRDRIDEALASGDAGQVRLIVASMTGLVAGFRNLFGWI